MIQIFGHDKCKGTRAAQRFFAERGVKVQMIDVRQKPPSKGELQSVARAVGGVGALVDLGSVRAREKGLQHAGASEARLIELLSEDGLLLTTPIVRNGQAATVGEAQATWKEWVAALKAAR